MATMTAPARTVSSCDAGKPGGCIFSEKRVRFFLLVFRQAHLAREPFDVVLRAETRNSRTIDPWIRGGGSDRLDARMVGWSIEDAGKRHGINILNPWNADKLAAVLCPDHRED